MIQSNMSREKEPDLKRLLAEGALVIDVRSEMEFSNGHLEASVNIPLDQLQYHLHAMNKKKAIITCCASGMRSEMAKNVLVANGFSEVYNAGSWSALMK
jgi:rhodanese-related sulfurtransferase